MGRVATELGRAGPPSSVAEQFLVTTRGAPTAESRPLPRFRRRTVAQTRGLGDLLSLGESTLAGAAVLSSARGLQLRAMGVQLRLGVAGLPVITSATAVVATRSDRPARALTSVLSPDGWLTGQLPPALLAPSARAAFFSEQAAVVMSSSLRVRSRTRFGTVTPHITRALDATDDTSRAGLRTAHAASRGTFTERM